MFTGIITGVGKVVGVRDESGGRVIRIQNSKFKIQKPNLETGESVCVNGVCLTVTRVQGAKEFEVYASKMTIDKTNLANLHTGSKVNLERALRLVDRIGGHIVQGHIDGVGKVLSRVMKGGNVIFRIGVSEELTKYLVQNGSIAVNGVSLTIADVGVSYFSVGLIPYTLEQTNLCDLRVGDLVNLEVDVLCKYLK